MADLNEAEHLFAAYLDDHSYAWKHEPDYQAELGLAAPLATKPDFLIERGGHGAVAEVRQFESSVLQNHLSKIGRAGVVRPEKVFGAQRSAMYEKAQQLRPLSGAGVPLLIVLANPLGKLVPLDDWHVQVAMWGNAAVSVPIDTTTGGAAEGRAPYLQLENYGVFASPVKEGDQIVGWENRHSRITAVMVVHERPYSDDWREEIFARYRAPDRSRDAAIDAYQEAQHEIDEAIVRGEEPQGSYRWVSVFHVNGDNAEPLPAYWFDGPRDERYGYTEGSYGRLPSEPSE